MRVLPQLVPANKLMFALCIFLVYCGSVFIQMGVCLISKVKPNIRIWYEFVLNGAIM